MEHRPSAAVLLPGLAETGARLEFSVGDPFPVSFGKILRPQCLRLGPYGHIRSEALELREISRIDQFIILPGCRWLFNRHIQQSYTKNFDISEESSRSASAGRPLTAEAALILLDRSFSAAKLPSFSAATDALDYQSITKVDPPLFKGDQLA